MCEVPLTHEQRIFAAKHHDLVYKFLNENGLSQDEYYDVVIFGYLTAVRRYLTIPTLRQYSFNTIAWKGMSGTLNNYERTKKYQKRNAEIISIHYGLSRGNIPLEDSIPAHDDLMTQLEMKLLLHDLATRLSKQQMDMIHLKSYGYGIRDIARRQNLSLRHAKDLLEEVRIILLELCNE